MDVKSEAEDIQSDSNDITSAPEPPIEVQIAKSLSRIARDLSYIRVRLEEVQTPTMFRVKRTLFHANDRNLSPDEREAI
jgi:hypothetical protein